MNLIDQSFEINICIGINVTNCTENLQSTKLNIEYYRNKIKNFLSGSF